MTNYGNVKVILEKAGAQGDDYQVQWILEQGTSPHLENRALKPKVVRIAFNLKIDENGTLADYILKVKIRTATQKDLETVGKKLYEFMIGENEEKFEDLRRRLRNEGKGLRLRLEIKSPELVPLPWELLWNERLQFLTRSGVSIVRFTTDTDSVELNLTEPLKVLIASAAPSEEMFFDQDKYIESVRQAFDENVFYGSKPEIKTLKDATSKTLREELENNYSMFHFVGHGDFDERNSGIFLVKDNGERDFLVAPDLSSSLQRSGVKFAFLCSCNTAETSSKEPFRGVTQNLISQGIPAVIAMQYKFPQGYIATDFVEAFYQGLLKNGKTIDDAMAYARISLSYSNVSWCIPVLYAQYVEGKLMKEAIAPDKPLPEKNSNNSVIEPIDLKSILQPGSDQRDELLAIISNSSKLQNAENRRNFLINSGLENFISELNLSANPSDFADDVVIKLLNAERLYLLLKSLLKRDKLLSPENKRFLELLNIK